MRKMPRYDTLAVKGNILANTDGLWDLIQPLGLWSGTSDCGGFIKVLASIQKKILLNSGFSGENISFWYKERYSPKFPVKILHTLWAELSICKPCTLFRRNWGLTISGDQDGRCKRGNRFKPQFERRSIRRNVESSTERSQHLIYCYFIMRQSAFFAYGIIRKPKVKCLEKPFSNWLLE